MVRIAQPGKHTHTHTHTTHYHNNRKRQWCPATAEIWPGPVFESEPATSPIPCNKKPVICFPTARTIGDREGLGKDGNLKSSQFTCALSNIHVYISCPVLWTWNHPWHLSPVADATSKVTCGTSFSSLMWIMLLLCPNGCTITSEKKPYIQPCFFCLYVDSHDNLKNN